MLFTGPGTKLEERLKRGDKGINPLDEAAKEHDIFYDKFQDITHRHIADKILQKKAWKRVISKDANLGERTAALLTTGAMRVKRTLGMGLNSRSRKQGKGLKRRIRKKKTPKKGRGIAFGSLVKKAHKDIKTKNPDTLSKAVRIAVGAFKKNHKTRIPRVIPIPKRGGALPLIPILAGISALGGAVSGASNIIKSIKEIIDGRKSGDRKKIGNGLYLAPYRKNGYGLYFQPYQPKNLRNL